ncbi:hypothetical protein [Chryseobacterium indoltheticum]|uniref:hypothetical protein n=1 Tax=Chryseobacterium indoltheticum TaxID=254 RepID=UPI0028EA5346|nr:hypothetical protein [Chryseobacterium indoltheticum]
MKKTILWRCLFCQIFLLSFLSSGIVSAQTGPNDDFDGDGVINSIDIDDDNDGVPDAIESPNCYYTASEIAIPASVTTTVAHSGTIANLYDNNPATLFNFTNGTTKVNLTVFEVTPIRPVVAAGLQIEMNFYGQTEFSNTAASLTMEGWNGTAWITLMPAFNPSTAPNTAQGFYQTFNFTQNQNTAYSKFRLQGLAGTIVGSQIREVKMLMPNNYIASLYPKTSCTDANIDGDNILPHFDLDSDGDGYSDALEAGATTNTASNYQFPDVDANNDGLVDAVDADNNGYVNYNSTYFEYALNKNISATADSDGDGIADGVDLDDDNDGIPDTVECGSGIQTIAGGVKNLTETLPSGLNASNALYSQYGLIIRERSKVAPYNIVRDNFNIISHSGDADNEYIYFGDAVSYSFEYYNPFTNQKRLVNRIQVSAEPGTDGSTLTLICFDDAGTVIYTGTFPDGSTMSVDTTQTLNNSKIHRFIVSGSNNTTGFDQVFVQGMSVFAGSCDTDGDAVPNHLDLDSDGDGCSDLAESGVLPNPPGDISTPSSTTNNNGTSYGIAANKLTGSQLNPNGIDLNNNGLNDSVESTTTPGAVNYPSTYNPYAIGSNYAACADTDGDTILDINDIDDDNDGVLDAVESPSCFSTAAEIAVPQSVTTQVANTGTIANVYDNNIATTFAFTNNSTKVNLTVFEITPSTPLKAIALYIRYNAATANALGATGSSVSVDGWNGTIWIPLQTYTPANSSANIQSFAIPSGSQAIYTKYRLQGILGTVSNVDITEVGLTAASDYIPSAHPKSTCTNDPDGDGVPNHRDLDSDGDGCSDSVEAGNTVYTSNNTTTFNTGADANNNGLLNQFESSTTAGTVNYVSTYTDYATNAAISACLDSDGDAVPDITDIDDDNDGVLDTIEQFCRTGSSVTITGTNTTVIDNNEFSYYENNDQVIIDFPYSFQKFNALFWSVDYLDNFTVTVKLDDGTLVGPLDGRVFYSTSDPSWITRWTTKGYPVAASNVNWTQLLGEYIGTPFNTGDVFYTSPITNNLSKAWGAVEFTIPQATTTNGIDKIILTIKPGIGTTAFAEIEPLNILKTCTDIDTDNDGIPNRLDLDSDGDGCPDTKEAILYNHSTEASVPGTVKNGSGGAVTSTTPNVPNAMVPGPYGSNGFADALQSASNPDAYKHVYTYQFIADAADVSACDNKFLMDIDTDDDGIPDAVESPSCFYTEAQAIDITEAVTSDFTWATANPLSNTYDNNTATTNYGAVTPAVSIQNKALIAFDLPVIDAALIDNVKLITGNGFGTGKWKLQGLDIDTNTWIDLSDLAGQAMNSATTFTFINTLHATTRYHSYRIIGIDNVNITNNARLIEFTIQYKNYNPSLHRTKMGCNSDNDGDGVPNYVDRDSDGDGCPDAVEAGIDKALLVPANFFNAGGNVPGTHVIVGGNYGDNGIGDNVETMPDSGITNYASTYTQYAINSALNVCTDTDGDGIVDLNDIDDDNDGIVDAVESPACFYTAAEANTITSVTSPLNAAAGDPTANTEIATLHNGNTSDANPYNFVSQSVASGATIFTVTYPTPVTLSSITVTQIASGMSTNASAFGKLYGSVDGVSYILLTSGNGIALSNTSVTFANAVTTPYRYYQIRSVGTVATGDAIAFNTGTAGIQEISSVIAVTPVYLASAHPKPGICSVDTDGDGVPNHLDLNSDGDGCSDLAESGVSPATDISTPASVTNNNGLSYGIAAFKLSGSQLNPMATDANNDGLNDSVDPDQNGITNYTSTYANAINMAIANCFCYVPAATSGIVLDTPQGITSLGRAGVNADNWPMVRKGAWTALEAKTKGFVPNRLTIAQINLIPAGDLREGMMVYNISSDCLYINTDGTPTGWKCFNTQACPD